MIAVSVFDLWGFLLVFGAELRRFCDRIRAEFFDFRHVFGARRMRKQRKACARCRRECPATFEAVLRQFFDCAARCAPTTRAKINENRAIFDRIRRNFRVRHARSECKMDSEATDVL